MEELNIYGRKNIWLKIDSTGKAGLVLLLTKLNAVNWEYGNATAISAIENLIDSTKGCSLCL